VSWQFNLQGIGAAFAEAAVDPSKWPAAMDRVAEATNSHGALLVPVRGGPVPNVPFSESLALSLEEFVRAGWIHCDVRYSVSQVIARRGVATEFDFITADEIARHPYYQEFLARFGLRWFAGVKVAAGDDFWCCPVQRTVEQGPFSPGELTELAELSTHLSSAAALARALGFARVEASLDAFEVSGKAVVLFDRCGDVLRMNQAAERMLGRDLQVVRGRLTCADREATVAVDRALHAAIRSTDNLSLLPPVILPRCDGRPILAYPSRPAGIAVDVFAPCAVLLALVDLEERTSVPESDLVRTFKLTPAEARLASRLLTEDSLETVAEHLGIAHETARNLLKRVLSKTGTHKQGQLIALLSRFQRRPALSELSVRASPSK
jgi:DNA-binding CsgD family transcriptional regulator/PAS domain-containing protein